MTKKPTIVHVNRHTINRNKRNDTDEPDMVVRTSRSAKPRYGRSVDVLDKDGNVVATLSSHRDRPLSCGATVWLECKYGVALRGEVRNDDSERTETGRVLPEKSD